MKFKESQLAHQYLDGLKGLEIGGSAHNSFGLDTKNVDYTDDMSTVFKRAEVKMCGEAMPVDIIAEGDKLPVADESQDFVISSHTIEHIFDLIGALKEWHRVIKKGGYIFTIAPITRFVPFEKRPTTTLQELIDRHEGRIKKEEVLGHQSEKSLEDGVIGEEIIRGILEDVLHGHWTVLDTNLFREVCEYLNYNLVVIQEVDDKVGNGFTTIIKKQ